MHAFILAQTLTFHSSCRPRNYEGNYSKSRQELQDAIVHKLLDGTMIHDTTNGRVCKTPTEPWIVFTAGVMVSMSMLHCCGGGNITCFNTFPL